ncbi:hypothetical protein C0033_10750 [Clostridium sp. chh4-2]|uniref:hypothetical protein n=1 Tax=Clostridium sp. chh4-2 TaxID=2067550 RepID=UPI000CCE0274|nr:hypothetical protein [Clostridium sp. chh4-2]PNV62123.1 hypothetical protein C0033_10750 [Clostridium sp. chh4-2]
MKEFESLENYIDDDLVLLLSKDIFPEKPLSLSKTKRGRIWKNTAGKGMAAAACLLFILAIWNVNGITAAAKGLAAFLFGGRVTESETDGYYVLREAVTFGTDGSYCLELAYRDGSDVYAVISRNNADGVGKASLVVNGRSYEESDNSSRGMTVVEQVPGSEQEVKGKSELQCHFTGVEMSSDMTFLVEGQSVTVRLEAPFRTALNQDMTVNTSGVQWTVFPLTPDKSMVGIIMETDHVWGTGKNQCSVELFQPSFIGESGRRYEAESIGEGNQVWKAVEKPQEAVVGFGTEGLVYELYNTDGALLTYTFRVPERGGYLLTDDILSVDGLELRLKRIERSEEDHITLFFEPDTSLGVLSGGSLSDEAHTSHGCGAGGDEFSLSLGYTYYRMEDDHKTVKEAVYQFPYDTGDEMTVAIEKLQIRSEIGGEAGF